MRDDGIQTGRLLLAVCCCVCFAASPAMAGWEAQADEEVPATGEGYTEGDYMYTAGDTEYSFGHWKLGSYCNLAFAEVNVWANTNG